MENFTLSCGIAVLQNQAQFVISLCYSVQCLYIFLWGFAVFIPPSCPPPTNGSVFSHRPLIIFEIPYLATVASKEI